jgi:hypothetical protein
MIRFLFVLIALFILTLFYSKSLAYLKVFLIKKKIKNQPLIGIREPDGSYYYKEGRYTVSYRIKESLPGNNAVEFLFLKRRLTSSEEKILKIKRGLNNFFLYQRWITLLRPSAIGVLIVSLVIFYLGIKEVSLRRIERSKWIVAQITGVSPESISYTGGGWFKISGQRRSRDSKVKPVSISFNPLSWLFSSQTTNVSLWSDKLNRYITYPVTVSDKGDVWVDKKSSQIHGRASGNKIVWDEPQRAGINYKVSGHHITVEDGKLKFIDE